MSTKSVVANIALVVVTLLVAVGVGEATIRIMKPIPPGIYEPDSAALYRLVPGSRKINRGRGAPFNIDINADGYRGPAVRPKSSVRRIAVFGDSFIAAEFSRLPETFVEQLRTVAKAKAGDSVETINVGVAGYGPDQTLLRMRADLERFKPDVAVLALFPFNDFGDLLRNKLLALDASGALVPRGGRLTDSMATEFTRASHPSGLRRLQLVRFIERELETRRRRGQTRTRPPLLEFTRRALRTNDSTLAVYDNRANSLVGYEVFRDEYDADIAVSPESKGAARKIPLMGAVLRAISEEAARAKVPLVVLIIPAPEDNCPTFERHADSASFPTYARSRLTDTAERLSREAGITTINLWEPFLASNACTLYLGRGDNHWNAAGQALAARVVADTLAAHGWLKP